MKAASATFCVVTIFSLPSPLPAKGDTVKVRIQGAGLAAPIEITGPSIRQFSVWAGPGVFVNGVEQTEGFIIDWPKGVVAQLPAGLQRYEVFFYSNFRNREGSVVYAVSYSYDPSAKQGFIYLPGKGDEWFDLNGSTMFHGRGREGNWFRATSTWESLVRPLIAKARSSGPGR